MASCGCTTIKVKEGGRSFWGVGLLVVLTNKKRRLGGVKASVLIGETLGGGAVGMGWNGRRRYELVCGGLELEWEEKIRASWGGLRLELKEEMWIGWLLSSYWMMRRKGWWCSRPKKRRVEERVMIIFGE
ncbi:unnamed protein product [Dovyalis caffra]|uniref:Uncharacterized protein n=1 Tax=Dovyalis caffra TaxID=77055 RepID=A0AAV1SGF0_9ROSI|nr:unnamed protein product [Dovyalis caffra]